MIGRRTEQLTEIIVRQLDSIHGESGISDVEEVQDLV